MKPTTEILARISQNSLANKEEVFTKLYRYLLRPDIYFVAWFIGVGEEFSTHYLITLIAEGIVLDDL